MVTTNKYCIIILKQTATVWVLFICLIAKGQSISGYVVDANTKEHLVGVSLADSSGKFLTYTNQDGYFSLSKTSIIKFSLLGYQTKQVTLTDRNEKVEIQLVVFENTLAEITIKESYRENYESNITKLSIQDIKRFPSILGEKDLIKVVQTLPGVKRMVEGGSGFSVRGGGTDQNLVMLDNVPVYSYNHLFGLFSMFNTDAVKDIEFIKNGISAQYGGRSSSVLNVRLKDGNAIKWQGNASLGLLSSKICLDGPIVKNKTTILISARRSYLDILTKPFMSKNYRQAYILGDYGFKLSHTLNQNSRLFTGFYHSNDVYTEQRTEKVSPTLQIYTPFSFGWKNSLGYLRYVYVGKRGFANIQAYKSHYNFNYFEKVERSNPENTLKTNQLDYNSYITDIGFNLDKDWIFSKNQTFKVGVGGLQRIFLPRSVNQSISEEGNPNIKTATIESQRNLEGYTYGEFRKQIGDLVGIGGIRTVVWYRDKWRSYLEPRLSLTYSLPKQQTFRLGYFRINQFVHLLSNTGGSLPTDMWISVSEKIRPQISEQLSFGYSFTFSKQFRVELDLYHKKMSNLLMYQEGANFLDITEGLGDSESLTDWESVLTSGKGKSIGLEFYLRKSTGKLQGSISYTLSRTMYLFDKLNFGNWFFPKFDRLHDFNLNISYPLRKHIILSSSFVFATGSPITLPNGLYQTNIITNSFQYLTLDETAYYSGINNYRSDLYHRIDLGVSFNKKKKYYTRSWEVSTFNLYARKNPFYYSLNRKNLPEFGVIVFEPQKRSFLSIVPSVSYNITF